MRHARHPLFAGPSEAADPGGSDSRSDGTLHALFDNRATGKAVPGGGSLFLEGDPVATLVRVQSGMLRCCIYSEDGRRQVLRFAGPGDILGIYAIAARGWPYSVEASVESEVEVLPRAVLDAALHEDETLLRAVHAEALGEMEQRGRTLAMLAEPRAEVRLFRFLSDMAGHGAATDADRRRVLALAMSRRDIADHLGLSHETVSRAFTALRRQHLIEMQSTAQICLTGGPGG